MLGFATGVPVCPLRICESCSLPTPTRGSFCDQCGRGLEHSDHESSVVLIASIDQLERPLGRRYAWYRAKLEAPNLDEGKPAAPRQFVAPDQNNIASREAVSGELAAGKRVVNVWFADISGFRQLSERLEPD